MSLPFTSDPSFELCVAYNRAFRPVGLTLWLYALAGAVVLAPRRFDFRRDLTERA